MLIDAAMHPGQLGDAWLAINLAASSAAYVVAWLVVRAFALLLGTFALLWVGTFTLIWFSAFWHCCLDQFGQTPQPYDFWDDLRSIDDECYAPHRDTTCINEVRGQRCDLIGSSSTTYQ